MTTTHQFTEDQIQTIGSLVPAGVEFSAVAKQISVKETDEKTDPASGAVIPGRPYLALTFEILDGEFEGIEFPKTYFPRITISAKNSKPYAPSLMELLGDMKAIGKPMPTGYPYEQNPSKKDVTALAKLVGQRVKRDVTPRIKFKTVAEKVQERNADGKWVDAYNDDGSRKTRVKFLIVGVGGTPHHVESPQTGSDNSSESSDPVDFL